MIRPMTCACMLLAGGAGLYLYQVKHRAQLLDREIASVVHNADTARARTKMLHAEWALLNEPERLQDLAEHFLQLHPMAPAQFVQMQDLASRLPAPVMGSANGVDESGEGEDALGGMPMAQAEPTPAPSQHAVAGHPTAALPNVISGPPPLLSTAAASPAPAHVASPAPSRPVAVASVPAAGVAASVVPAPMRMAVILPPRPPLHPEPHAEPHVDAARLAQAKPMAPNASGGTMPVISMPAPMVASAGLTARRDAPHDAPRDVSHETLHMASASVMHAPGAPHATPAPMTLPSMSLTGLHPHPSVRTVQAYAPLQGYPVGGSMLGMGMTRGVLPPPVPVTR